MIIERHTVQAAFCGNVGYGYFIEGLFFKQLSKGL
jgi:hypothetical protein